MRPQHATRNGSLDELELNRDDCAGLELVRNTFLEVQLRRIRNAGFPLAFTGFEFRFEDPMNPERDPAPYEQPDREDPEDGPGDLAFP